MIKIKVFKKKFYIESYFFAVCENEEGYFGFDLGGFVSSEIAGETGILGVAVKCVDIERNTGGEGESLDHS